MNIFVNTADYRSIAYSDYGLVWNSIQVEVPDDFSPCGKTYNPDTKEWISDAPYLRTEHDVINDSIAYRDTLVHEARTVIHDWTVELGLGTISDEDKASLAGWMVYIKALNAMKFEGGPDSVAWPDKPE